MPLTIFGQVIHPQSKVALPYQRANLKGNSLLLTTYQPYLVELDASTFTPIRTIEIKDGTLPQEFHRISDSVLYVWSPNIGIPPNNSNVILMSRDGGINWRLHPNLRTTSGELTFIDSSFIVDGKRFLNRYTLDGGQSYQSPNAANYEIAGIHDSGVYLYQAQSDSLWNLDRRGWHLQGILDTNFQSLRHLYQTSSGYIALSDSGAIIELDTNLHYLRRQRQILSGLYARGQFYSQDDTVALVWGDSIYYSQNGGQSWSSDFLPSLVSNATFHCLAFMNGELLFANGAGSLAAFSLRDGSSRYIGGNDNPLVNDRHPYSGGSYALSRNNVQLSGQSQYRFHQIDPQGKLLRSTPLPFLDLQSPPNMVVLDSLKILICSRDTVYESGDAGLTWLAYASQGVLSTPKARKAERDSTVFLYQWGANPFLFRWTFGGQRTSLNFNFSTGERILELAFWNRDSGLVFTNGDVYRTLDGGQSFSALNHGPLPFWQSQWRSDTLLVAAGDFNYRIQMSAGGLAAIDSQAIQNAWFTPRPYHFINETQVVSYVLGLSKIAIADSKHDYYQELDIPVDQVYRFYTQDNRLYASIAGGALLIFDLDSLFPADIGIREFHTGEKSKHLWPNPVQNRFFIDAPACDHFLIFNHLGQKVYRGSYDEFQGGLVSGLIPGVYYLQAWGAGKPMFCSKILFQPSL